MNDPDLTHLRRLAEAASEHGSPEWGQGDDMVVDSNHTAVARSVDPTDAAYIAAANPAAILALLDERDRALEHLQAARETLAPHGDIDNPGLTQEGNQALGQVCAAIAELEGEAHDIPVPREVRLRKDPTHE